MKKYIVLVVALFNVLFLNAKFDGRLSSLCHVYVSCMCMSDETEGYGGLQLYNNSFSDTIIDGTQYQYITKQSDRALADTIYLREEGGVIYASCVYIYKENTSIKKKVIPEQIVCDFNLEAGDILAVNQYSVNGTNTGIKEYVVARTDSVLLPNGIKAKRIFYDNGYKDYTYEIRTPDVEYLGNIKGIKKWFPVPYNSINYDGAYIGHTLLYDGEPFEYSIVDSLRWCKFGIEGGLECDTYFSDKLRNTYLTRHTKKNGTYFDEKVETQSLTYTMLNGRRYLTDGTHYLYSEGNKVYVFEKGNEPTILYDFDLQVGDKILTNAGAEPYYATVTGVKEIELLDKRKAKVISYDKRFDDIEFLGASQGGILDPYITKYSPNSAITYPLICSYYFRVTDGEQNFTYYYRAFNGACEYVITDVDEADIEPFELYPNPTKGRVEISLNDINQVQIFNALGQKVYSTTAASFDISHLANGLYIINITTNDGKRYNSKLIKE